MDLSTLKLLMRMHLNIKRLYKNTTYQPSFQVNLTLICFSPVSLVA